MLKLNKNLKNLPRIYSGIQPTGIPHLGNYLGAIKQWADISQSSTPEIKDKFIYSVVDLHAMTVKYDKNSFSESVNQTLACLIASGLNPNTCILYRQSQVREHAYLYYLLSCHTLFSDLNDMTQWKHKSDQHGSKLGLYTYPILMAADILLYRTDIVPVGEDQIQHLQLAREICNRINKKFSKKYTKKQRKSGEIYQIKLPTVKISSDVARVKSLTSPSKKMSKSDPHQNSCILLTDGNDTIREKILNATFDDQGLGRKNLVEIAKALDKNMVNSEFEYLNDSKLKDHLVEVLVETIQPIRVNYLQLMDDRVYLKQISDNGTDEARNIAQQELKQIKQFIGL